MNQNQQRRWWKLASREEYLVDQEQQSRWRPTRGRVLWGLGIIAGLAVLGSIFGGYVFGWEWTGLAKDANFHKRTLWDWLQLLIIPAVLAGVGLWFNRQQREQELQTASQQREQELQIADRRAQDEALQAYLDQIGQLLLDKVPPLRQAKEDDEVRTLARARTLTVLARLDGERKGSIVRFLSESALIQKEEGANEEHVTSQPVISLSGGADLSWANLGEADLGEADLRGSDLSWAHLSKAKLTKAKLSGAKLSRAYLGEADLSGADLSGAMLSEAKLTKANLTKANLSKAHLHHAGMREAVLVEANLSKAWLLSTYLGEADLSGADLSGAMLSEAKLTKANLSKANLSGTFLNGEVDLSEADLSGADLRGIKRGFQDPKKGLTYPILTNEELEQLYPRNGGPILEGATMPNGQKYEDWLKDR